MGLLQGVSELFPVSSLGHSVLIPKILHWNIALDDPLFLSFIVATHLATALVLLAFYRKEWLAIIRGVLARDVQYIKLLLLLVVGTIPAGILGLLLQHKIRGLFTSTWVIAVALILNGIMLYSAELYKKSAKNLTAKNNREIGTLSLWESCKIGVLQSFALIPGFSRSGASMVGGILSGLSETEAVHFSFLLATPIILAAAVLEVPKLFHHSTAVSTISGGAIFIGLTSAGVGAYIAVKFLTKFVQTKSLKPFAYYCIGFGVLALILLK
jgi:undecaprenyl-diphosphatase